MFTLPNIEHYAQEMRDFGDRVLERLDKIIKLLEDK